MMTMANYDKTSKTCLFDGKAKNFPCWKEKFLARACKKEFCRILTGMDDIPQFVGLITTTGTDP